MNLFLIDIIIILLLYIFIQQKGIKDIRKVFDKDEIYVFDDEFIENSVKRLQKNVKITKKKVQLFDDGYLDRIKENIEIIEPNQEKLQQIKETQNDIEKHFETYKQFFTSINSILEYIERLNQTVIKLEDQYRRLKKERRVDYINNKSFFPEYVDDKLIDKILNNPDKVVFKDFFIFYDENVIVRIRLNSSPEFWFIEIVKDLDIKRYGLNKNQKIKLLKFIAIKKLFLGMVLSELEKMYLRKEK